jgi:hypothetical protein
MLGAFVAVAEAVATPRSCSGRGCREQAAASAASIMARWERIIAFPQRPSALDKKLSVAQQIGKGSGAGN